MAKIEHDRKFSQRFYLKSSLRNLQSHTFHPTTEILLPQNTEKYHQKQGNKLSSNFLKMKQVRCKNIFT